MEKTYSEEEVCQIIIDIARQTMLDTALKCAEYCDLQRGMLSVGDDIRKHYGITLEKPKLKSV